MQKKAQPSIKDGWWPKIKPGNESKLVLVHETGHAMVQFRYGVDAGTISLETHKAAQKIYRKYITKVKASYKEVEAKVTEIMNGADRSRYTSMEWLRLADQVRGQEIAKAHGDWWVSQYATKNLEEFWCESFAQVQLSDSPSPFAKEIVDLMRGKIDNKYNPGL